MGKKAICVDGGKLYGPYTPGVKAGGMIWLSGQIDVDAGDDINDFAAMNEVYGAWVDGMEIKPARAAFEAGALPAGALVEIVVQAIDSN